MEIKFKALVKEVKAKALVSLDKGIEIKLQGTDLKMLEASMAPADKEVFITITWIEEGEI